jgi:hypothetical protein
VCRHAPLGTVTQRMGNRRQPFRRHGVLPQGRAYGGANVSGHTCGIVMLAHGTRPWSCAFFRLIEIVLGIAVAWLLSFGPELVQDRLN